MEILIVNIICRTCQTSKPHTEYYRATKGKKNGKDYLDKVCKSCKHEQQQKRRKDLKDRIVQHLGGKCIRCGYDRCTAALDVHHLDATQKEFALKGSDLRKWGTLLKELNKCVLLCSVCHREVHYYNDPDYILAPTTGFEPA